VFSEQGFDGARMEDVAARAAISKAGVYLYFPSKEALLEALIEREIAPIAARAAMLAAAGADAPVETLASIAQFVSSRLLNADTIRVPRLMLSIAARFPAIAEHYRARVVDVALAAVESLIVAGVARGAFRGVAPRAAARAFIGPILVEVLYTNILGGKPAATPDAMIAGHLDIFMSGVAAETSR
jgi:AcrR family transcriptional regulator